MYSGKSPGSVASDAEVAYKKAAKAELSRDYDSAFRFYIKAAESFLHLSRTNSYNDREKADSKASAAKALQRAEKIKAFVNKVQSSGGNSLAHTGVDVNLTPVGVNSFSEQEQFYVLKKGELINGLRFSLWEEHQPPSRLPSRSQSSVSFPSRVSVFQDPDGQPLLSAGQLKFRPIWERPRIVTATSANTIIPQENSFVKINEQTRRFLLPQQIIQHIVTDCSVCASVSVCLEHTRRFGSNLAQSSIYSRSQPRLAEEGRYDIKLLINGAWRRVVVDDKLPYSPLSNKLLCMSTSLIQEQDEAIWPSLLEKGYMKLMGGYDFPGSNSSIDLHVLAGWIPEHIEIKSPSFEREKTWERIIQGFNAGKCILTLGTGQSKGEDIQWNEVNLLASHSYAVIDVIGNEGDRALTVLDSWLPYSDLDVSADNQDDEKQESRLLKIPWSDIVNVFHGIYLSWDPSQWENKLEFHGMWKRKQDGEQTIIQNLRLGYQFIMKNDDDDEIWILLTRHVVDTRRTSEYISLTVQVDDDLGSGLGLGDKDLNKIGAKGTYTNSTHILVRTQVYSLQSPGVLSIFASYDGKSSEVGFTLSVYSSSTMKMSWHEDTPKAPYTTKVDGALTSKNSGGNCASPSFMLNPQYHLHIHPQKASTSSNAQPNGKAVVVLLLQVGKDIPINLTLVWSQGERVVELRQNEIAAHSGAYVYGLARVRKELLVGDYTLILSAFEPRHTGPFSLRVESSHQFDLTAIPQEGAGMYSKTLRGAWDEQTAVGGPSFKRYFSNPIFEIEVPSAAQLKIRLQLIQHSTATSLNITLYAAPSNGPLGQQLATSGGYDDVVSGVATPQVLLSKGKYWAVPSTFNPGERTAFRLIVYSTVAGVNIVERQHEL